MSVVAAAQRVSACSFTPHKALRASNSYQASSFRNNHPPLSLFFTPPRSGTHVRCQLAGKEAEVAKLRKRLAGVLSALAEATLSTAPTAIPATESVADVTESAPAGNTEGGGGAERPAVAAATQEAAAAGPWGALKAEEPEEEEDGGWLSRFRMKRRRTSPKR